MQELISRAADLLFSAEQSGIVCQPVRSLIGADNIDAAYQVQSEILSRKLQQGEQVVGQKIGLTSFAVQKQLGVDQPDFGALLSSRQVEPGSVLNFADLMQPKVEAEIAFIMKGEVGPNADLEEIEANIDYAVASLEIVGSRVANWDITIADTIADNASASHFVLGQKKATFDELDLVNCSMKLWKNDVLESQGKGEACLGNPLNAVRWLVNKFADLNNPVKAGDIILSGALGPMVSVSSGDEIRAEIEGLGSVELTIG